jgi:hypothetical protein
VLQPVHEFGVTGRPIVRGHRVAFRCTLRYAIVPARWGVWPAPAGARWDHAQTALAQRRQGRGRW